MGFLPNPFGGGSETTTVTPFLSPSQQQLTAQQVQLGAFQLEELQNQREAQAEAFGGVDTALAGFDEFVDQQAGQIGDIGGIQDELLEGQLERIRSGGAASDREVDLINQAIEQALAAGSTDIERFRTENLGALREELAPQLGLRPGDTPILDRGARIGAEALRQQGALSSSLRGQQAATLLNFPLQRSATLGLLSGAQQERLDALQQFQADLRQSAFTNRLQLAGGRSTAGLGLASVSAPNVGGVLGNIGSTSTTDRELGFGEIAGGLGAVLGGLGAIGEAGGFAALPSSRNIKNTHGPVNERAILSALKSLPVEAWNYIGDDQKHIGTFAEDFRKAFGVGDGKTISIIDALGVLMASVKALAGQRETADGTA